MLKRLYVNNHKCLVNFEWKPGEVSLLMGPNGAGKSTVLACLDMLREFIVGDGKTHTLFLEEQLTRWTDEKVQAFELDVQGEAGMFTYSLRVEIQPGLGRAFVREESLKLDGMPLFEMKTGSNMLCEARLYRDDGSSPDQPYPFDWTRSGVGFLQNRPDNKSLSWFREFMGRMLVVRINPFAMKDESTTEAPRPSIGMNNFVDWYRFVIQERQSRVLDLQESLSGVLSGLTGINLPQTGEKRRMMRVEFGNKKQEYSLSELSEGQRALIVLYTVLHMSLADQATICIDEPDNFIATREIQPWLMDVKDQCMAGAGQAILVSHHPEIVDYLGVSYGYWMEREARAPARIREIDGKDSNLKLSELTARGWVGE